MSSISVLATSYLNPSEPLTDALHACEEKEERSRCHFCSQEITEKQMKVQEEKESTINRWIRE